MSRHLIERCATGATPSAAAQREPANAAPRHLAAVIIEPTAAAR